jgi:hypothetical protein
MKEGASFIRADISDYGAMLKLHMGRESRAALERLLAEAERRLAMVLQERRIDHPRAGSSMR